MLVQAYFSSGTLLSVRVSNVMPLLMDHLVDELFPILIPSRALGYMLLVLLQINFGF